MLFAHLVKYLTLQYDVALLIFQILVCLAGGSQHSCGGEDSWDETACQPALVVLVVVEDPL